MGNSNLYCTSGHDLYISNQQCRAHGISQTQNQKEIHLDNLVLFKMNKTELAGATQVFRTSLKAYSIKGLAYFKRPSDSHKAKTNSQIAL